MSGLLLLKPDVDWTSSGGLFDWVLDFLSARLSDNETAGWLRQVVDANIGSVWLTEFPSETQHEILRLLRDGLMAAAERELPEGPAKLGALADLQRLVDLAGR